MAGFWDNCTCCSPPPEECGTTTAFTFSRTAAQMAAAFPEWDSFAYGAAAEFSISGGSLRIAGGESGSFYANFAIPELPNWGVFCQTVPHFGSGLRECGVFIESLYRFGINYEDTVIRHRVYECGPHGEASGAFINTHESTGLMGHINAADGTYTAGTPVGAAYRLSYGLYVQFVGDDATSIRDAVNVFVLFYFVDGGRSCLLKCLGPIANPLAGLEQIRVGAYGIGDCGVSSLRNCSEVCTTRSDASWPVNIFAYDMMPRYVEYSIDELAGITATGYSGLFDAAPASCYGGTYPWESLVDSYNAPHTVLTTGSYFWSSSRLTNVATGRPSESCYGSSDSDDATQTSLITYYTTGCSSRGQVQLSSGIVMGYWSAPGSSVGVTLQFGAGYINSGFLIGSPVHSFFQSYRISAATFPGWFAPITFATPLTSRWSTGWPSSITMNPVSMG